MPPGAAAHESVFSPALPIVRPVKLLAAILLLSAALASADPEMQGMASWYGGKFHGRLTSNGEIFDTNTLTAAHKTLPFGTLVKVTNLDNGKSVVVRINDRGPFVEGRIIDLSRAGAEGIDMVGQGVAHVSLEIVGFATNMDLYAIQVGAYAVEKNAERTRDALVEAGLVATIDRTGLGVFRVSVRGVSSADLPEIRRKLESSGFTSYLVKKEQTQPAAVPAASDQGTQG
jgi:rare lipoprotein A